MLTRRLRQIRIHQHKRRHRLHNRHRPRHHARVMSALGFQNPIHRVIRHRRLGLADRRRGLESHPEINVRAVGDTALDATRIIGLGRQPRSHRAVLLLAEAGHGGFDCGRGGEGIIVDGARDGTATEAAAYVEAFGCGDREHCVCEHGFQLVEDGFAQPDGAVADDAGDGAADAVFLVAVVGDFVGHAGSGFFVRAADGEKAVDLLAGYRV